MKSLSLGRSHSAGGRPGSSQERSHLRPPLSSQLSSGLDVGGGADGGRGINSLSTFWISGGPCGQALWLEGRQAQQVFTGKDTHKS